MTVIMCDKCGEKIVEDKTLYYIQLEEWDNTGFHREVPERTKKVQVCLECYKKFLNEVM